MVAWLQHEDEILVVFELLKGLMVATCNCLTLEFNKQVDLLCHTSYIVY